jgi:hypothetical protein
MEPATVLREYEGAAGAKAAACADERGRQEIAVMRGSSTVQCRRSEAGLREGILATGRLGGAGGCPRPPGSAAGSRGRRRRRMQVPAAARDAGAGRVGGWRRL